MCKKEFKVILLCIIIAFSLTLLSGCKSAEEYGLTGINVVFYPVTFMWDWLWHSFTPGFWTFIELVWNLPVPVNVIAGILANVLGAVLYVVILVIILVVILLLGILCALAFFIGAILNGIFHFA